MLDSNLERVPQDVRKLLKPSRCYDGDCKLEHDWGDLFLFENFAIMRVYACPQPPHVLPKFVLESLGIMEFFWQLILMNIEHLGSARRKVCRNFKIGI